MVTVLPKWQMAYHLAAMSGDLGLSTGHTRAAAGYEVDQDPRPRPPGTRSSHSYWI